jgi:hypothetical protein
VSADNAIETLLTTIPATVRALNISQPNHILGRKVRKILFNISPFSFFRLAIADNMSDAADSAMDMNTEKRFKNVAVRYHGP